MAQEKQAPDGSVQVFSSKGEDEGRNVEAGKPESDGRRPSDRLHMVTKRDIDDTTLFYNKHKGDVGPLDAEGIKKLNRKNFWFLLSQTWWIAFLIHLDKSTLAQASTMGIFKDVAMTKNEYNNLFVVFYTGYLIALWPGAALSQRIGHKHFITGSLLLWALLLGMHPVVKTGKQMIALRFLLGMVSCLSCPLCPFSLHSPAEYRPSRRSSPRRRCFTRPSSLPRRAPGSSSSGGPRAASPTSS